MHSFPGGSEGKASACNAGNPGLIPGSGRFAGEGNGNPVLLPGKSDGWRSLIGYSPWCRKESETTEQSMHIKEAGTCLPGLHLGTKISLSVQHLRVRDVALGALEGVDFHTL